MSYVTGSRAGESKDGRFYRARLCATALIPLWIAKSRLSNVLNPYTLNPKP